MKARGRPRKVAPHPPSGLNSVGPDTPGEQTSRPAGMAPQRPLPNLSVPPFMQSESEQLLQGMSAVVKDIEHLRSLMNSKLEEGRAFLTQAGLHVEGIGAKMNSLVAEGKRLQHELTSLKPTDSTTDYSQRRQARLERCEAIRQKLVSLKAEKQELMARAAKVKAAMGKEVSHS